MDLGKFIVSGDKKITVKTISDYEQSQDRLISYTEGRVYQVMLCDVESIIVRTLLDGSKEIELNTARRGEVVIEELVSEMNKILTTNYSSSDYTILEI